MVSNHSKQPRFCGYPFKPNMGELGIVWGFVFKGLVGGFDLICRKRT